MNSLFGVSYLLLWIMVIGESVLLFVLLRTIGHLLLANQPIGAREGVPVGHRLPDVPTATVDGARPLLDLLPAKRFTAVLFATPTCGYCPGALTAIRRAVAELPWLGAAVLVRAAELDGYAQVDEWGRVATITADAAQELQLRATPFVMVVDERGTVVAKGVINDESHLTNLIDAAEKAMANSGPVGDPAR
jgi:hypothetical protein